MNEYVLKYLNKLNVSSVNELSDEQVIHFFKEEYLGTPISFGYLGVESALRDKAFTIDQIVASMRKSLETGKMFECFYTIGESAIGIDGVPKEYGWKIIP